LPGPASPGPAWPENPQQRTSPVLRHQQAQRTKTQRKKPDRKDEAWLLLIGLCCVVPGWLYWHYLGVAVGMTVVLLLSCAGWWRRIRGKRPHEPPSPPP